MKTINAIVKVLSALAAVAGAVYIIATYGDKIVAWAKDIWEKISTVTVDVTATVDNAPADTAPAAGTEDFAEEEDSYEIYTDPDQWSAVDAALKEAGIEPISSEVTMIPQNWVELTDETAIKNLQRTLDLLEEDDDVQAVYHNWDE